MKFTIVNSMDVIKLDNADCVNFTPKSNVVAVVLDSEETTFNVMTQNAGYTSAINLLETALDLLHKKRSEFIQNIITEGGIIDGY